MNRIFGGKRKGDLNVMKTAETFCEDQANIVLSLGYAWHKNNA